MRAWHWILVLIAALAPPALYVSIVVAAAVLGYWKAIRNPPTLTMVYVPRAVPSGAPVTSRARAAPREPREPRTVEAPR
jgi:hypothetical protein